MLSVHGVKQINNLAIITYVIELFTIEVNYSSVIFSRIGGV